MSEIHDITKEKLNGVGCGFCLAKWTQVTMHLQTGFNHSCHHPSVHKIPLEEIKLKGNIKNPFKVIINSNSGCFSFSHCYLKGIKNTESPKWLKDKLRFVNRSFTNINQSTSNRCL